MITETSTPPAMLPDLLKRVLYGSGLLGLIHRLRNRRTLTVMMFHRVLSPDDPRWASCDPDYTLDSRLFADCLHFFKRHYHVVDLAAVLDARRGGRPLPSRALLITFDDGWQDNVVHALPALQAAGLPGLLFVVADAVGRTQPFFQERLVAAFRRGSLQLAQLDAALAAQGNPLPAANGDGLPALRAAIGVLEGLPTGARVAVMATLEPSLDDGLRHMVERSELADLQAGGVAIGLHGKTHEPLTRAADLDAELGGARQQIGRALAAAAPTTMSFPHGRFDAQIAERARQAGYELLFTSVPGLNPSTPQPGWLLARIGFETAAIADRDGRFRPDLLALYLFRRPQRLLA